MGDMNMKHVRRVTEAEQVITEQLAKVWQQGYSAGWTEGVDDATLDDPEPTARNPYKRGD